MTHNIDILIIYAKADDEPTISGTGWVQDFKHILELMVHQLSGKKPKILLKSEYDSITGGNMKEVDILLPIISPNFIHSEACQQHLVEFVKISGKSDRSRIFKVVKSPVSHEDQPSDIGQLIGYDLYDFDLISNEIEDYNEFKGPEAKQSLWMKMTDLAYEIYFSRHKVKTIFSGHSIYLAQTSQDLSVERNIIKRELQRHGYKILPDKTLPSDVTELKEVVRKAIDISSMSIHLIGNLYGDIPPGSDKSIIDIQNHIAAEKSAELKDKNLFSRLIWISPNLEYANGKQLAFVENITRGLASSEGAEILQTPLEDFKSIVREELLDVGISKKINKKESATKNNNPQVYLQYDNLDAKAAEPLKKYIEQCGCTVLTPALHGKLLKQREHHINNLLKFDASIIYQANVSNDWVKMKFLDLSKSPGFGRKRPIKGNLLFSQSNHSDSLEMFKTEQTEVIDGNKKNALESLKAFLEDLDFH